MHPLHSNRYDTVVIGGGQAGLAAGYHLRQTGRSFVILDANERPGDAWRLRWDSLRLFSPAQYDGLPGLPFPGPDGTFPSKDEVADYLERYALHFDLPLVNGVRVTGITRNPGEMSVACAGRMLTAGNVIVATGAYSSPKVPDFAGHLNPSIQQLHSSTYRRPGDIAAGSILVAGFGTSGVEIAIELARSGRRVMLSGRPTAQALSKFVPAIFAARNPLLKSLGKLYWGFMHRVVTIDTPLGRKAKTQIALRGQPLVRLNQRDVQQAGVEPVKRCVGVEEQRPLLEDGRVLQISAVIWCTGFRPSFGFLDIPELPLDAKGWPVAPHGIVEQASGLYFLGMPFQAGLTSTLLGGAGRDAGRVVDHLMRRTASREHTDCPAAVNPFEQPDDSEVSRSMTS